MRLIDADALYKEIEERKAEAEARLHGVEPGNTACRLVYTTQVIEIDRLESLVAWMPTVDISTFLKDAECKSIPAQIKITSETQDSIGGFCPTCGSKVDVEKTFLRKQKGACCSWCGQRLDVEKHICY